MPQKRKMSDSAASNKNAKSAKDESDASHPASHQAGTGTEGKHEWKQSPPYAVHDSGKDFDVKLEASCHCGKVQYQLSRDTPLQSKFCHCTTCQTQHAAPFQWAAIFHKTDINFVEGHHNLEWLAHPDAQP